MHTTLPTKIQWKHYPCKCKQDVFVEHHVMPGLSGASCSRWHGGQCGCHPTLLNTRNMHTKYGHCVVQRQMDRNKQYAPITRSRASKTITVCCKIAWSPTKNTKDWNVKIILMTKYCKLQECQNMQNSHLCEWTMQRRKLCIFKVDMYVEIK